MLQEFNWARDVKNKGFYRLCQPEKAGQRRHAPMISTTHNLTTVGEGKD